MSIKDLVSDIRSSLLILHHQLNIEDEGGTSSEEQLEIATFMRSCLVMYNMIEDGAVNYTSHDPRLFIEAVKDVQMLKQCILDSQPPSEEMQLLMDNAQLLERTFHTMIKEIEEIQKFENPAAKKLRIAQNAIR